MTSALSIDPVLVWFLAGLALVLIEFVAPGIILIFFGLGAWVAAAAHYFGWAESLGSQVAWFAGASVVFLFGLRKFFKSWFTGDSQTKTDDNELDDFRGKQVVVLSAFSGVQRGKVEFKGADWSARASESQDAAFEVGERAVIKGIDGLCLLIQKL